MTTPINDGGPIHPSTVVFDNGNCVSHHPGLCLRDHFAVKAMQGQIAFEGMEGCNPKHIAAMSFELADAMLKEREKGKQ